MAIGKSLYLVLQPSGAKSWAFRYRWQRKARKLTLGAYPAMKLAHARAATEAARSDLKKGLDPGRLKAEEKHHPDSVEAVIDEYIQRHLRVNVDWPEAERILKRNVLPVWKRQLIRDIGKADILRLLDSIKDRGA